jgi:hypothetical protein
MKSLLPNNKMPSEYKYDQLASALLERGKGVALAWEEMPCGNNTVAYFVRVGHLDPQRIDLKLHNTVVARLYDDGTVEVGKIPYHYMSRATRRRLDRVMKPVGFRMKVVGGTWKIYRMSDGSYRDFHGGMVLR